MARKLSPQARVRRMMSEGVTQQKIGDVIGLSKTQVSRIARGLTSGASVEEPLRQFGKLGKRAKAAVVEGAVELPAKRQPKPKAAPVAPAPAPPVQKPAPAPSLPPKEVKVTIRGNLGPSRDPDYIRKRTISTTMKGEYAARFAELYAGDKESKARAYKYAVSHYFGSTGEGYLESIIGTPSVRGLEVKDDQS